MSEPATLHCANHPNRETVLLCGRCEKPICVDCTVQTPVGARCRECGVYRPIQYQVPWFLYLPAIIVGLIAGAIGGFIGSHLGIFSIFIAPVIGSLVGEGVSRAARRKAGVWLALIAGAAIVIGGVIGPPIFWTISSRGAGGTEGFTNLVLSQLTSPWVWIYVVIAAPAAFWRLR